MYRLSYATLATPLELLCCPFYPSFIFSQLCHELLPYDNLISSYRLKCPHNRWKPHTRHLNIALVIRMDSIPQIRAPTKARILIHNPYRAPRRIETLRPRHNRPVQILDLGVVISVA